MILEYSVESKFKPNSKLFAFSYYRFKSWPGKRPAPVFALAAAKKLGRLNIAI